MSNSPIRLNNSDKEVAQAIWQLFQAAYQIEASIIGVDSFPPLKRPADDINNSKSDFLGIYNKNSLIAVIEHEFKKPMLLIHSLAVSPSSARQGYGLKLLQYLFDQYPGVAVEVETAEENLPAVMLYKKIGFNVVSRFTTSENITKLVFRKLGI